MPVKNPIGLGPGLLPGAGFLGGYLSRILAVEPANLIGVWLQNEASGSVSFDHSGKGHNGLYTGVTLGQPGVPGMGMTSPLYDGANDFNNIYSAELNSDFEGAEGTLLAWAKVDDWEDSTARGMWRFRVDSSNYVVVQRTATNNLIRFQYTAGGTIKTIDDTSITDAAFHAWAITWSKSGDAVSAYVGGSQSGSAATGLGTWVGNLGATTSVIGALVTTPSNVWSGPIGPVALWNKALTAAQIAYLSTP